MRDPRQRIIIAVVVALLVGGLVYYYTSSKTKEAERAKAKIKPVKVYYAKDPIPARTEIKEEMLKLKDVPEAAVQPNWYKEDQKAKIVGKVTIAAFIADEAISKEKIAEKGAKMGLSFIVPKGKRAFTMRVSKREGLAYLLKPGDFVDVVSKFNVGIGGSKKKGATDLSVIIVQNAQVLALEQQMEVVQKVAEGGKEESETLEYDYVTLAVDPEDVPELNLLDRIGDNRFVLRAMNDFAKTPYKVSSMVSIVRKRKLPVFSVAEEEKKESRAATITVKAPSKPVSSLFKSFGFPKKGTKTIPTPSSYSPTAYTSYKKAKRKIKVYKGSTMEEVEVP